MAFLWISYVFFIVLTVAEATIYDDDYDSYTKIYDFKSSGNLI